MANYEVKDVKPAFTKLLEKMGAENIQELEDKSVPKRTRKRIILAKIHKKPIAIICFPIVVRTKANKKNIRPQRYVDFNSSAWEEIVRFWKQACFNQMQCLLLGMRHTDSEIGDYIFSIEGDVSQLTGKSIYIHSAHMEDIRNNIGVKSYSVDTELAATMRIIKNKYLKEYIENFENHISNKMFYDSIVDFSFKFGDENISVVETETQKEGKRLLYYTTKYERSGKNRKEAIKLHGTKCFGCGFDFEERYGERGKGYIEIHHTKPLYELDGETDVEPQTDLVPVCSNCHRMIHKKKNAILTIEELKKIIIN